MMRKLFGTDGIRGTANSEPMTPETALKVAMAVGECFHNGTHKHLVVIGKDTRLSGYMLEPALVWTLSWWGRCQPRRSPC
jgi:phosphoglucosamine mutase